MNDTFVNTNIITMTLKMQILPDEVIMNKIYFVRGKKVMIDRDLAELYGVETRALNQSVRRNKIGFRKILCSKWIRKK
jgi:hypothetical protein